LIHQHAIAQEIHRAVDRARDPADRHGSPRPAPRAARPAARPAPARWGARFHASSAANSAMRLVSPADSQQREFIRRSPFRSCPGSPCARRGWFPAPACRSPGCRGVRRRPPAAVSASGVAIPSAHGQAITSTAMACIKAVPGSPGVNLPDSECDRGQRQHGRDEEACPRGPPSFPFWCGWPRPAPRCARCAPAYSPLPTRVARTSSTPPVLILPPTTGSPVSFGMGADSPRSARSRPRASGPQ